MGPRMLLVGFDGSTPACDAIDDVRRAGLSLRGMAAVLSVADTGAVADLDEIVHAADRAGDRETLLALPMSRLQREALDQAIEISRAGAERLRRRLPEWHVDAIVMTARPVQGILQAARDCYAELIVVGTHGRSGVGRVLLGSVSGGVASAARCSVRIGRSRGEFGQSPPRIVVGVDHAADVAETLHAISVRDWPLGTAVHVVMSERADGGEQVAAIASEAETLLVGEQPPIGTMLHELATRGLGVTTRVVESEFERRVIEAAGHWGADLLVLGASDVDADLRIASRADCSVEIARPSRTPFGRPLENPVVPPQA